jgi:hypothetical protein
MSETNASGAPWEIIVRRIDDAGGIRKVPTVVTPEDGGPASSTGRARASPPCRAGAPPSGRSPPYESDVSAAVEFRVVD